MRVFFDTEFTGLRKGTTLVSIGCVSGDGQTFYAELSDYDTKQIDDWLKENVIAHLWYGHLYEVTPAADTIAVPHYYMKGTTAQVAAALRNWLARWDAVEMWSDCLAYDWVLFCHLFGGALNIPKNVYYIPFDLSTLLKVRGCDPDISREELSGPVVGQKHNALYEADVIGMFYHNMEKAQEP